MLNQNPDEFVLKQIKNLCNERNWSLYRLSMESSIPYSTLNNLFRRGNVPSINTLCKICDAFRISLSEFFSGNNDALSSLNPEQQNLIGCWNLLSKEDKKSHGWGVKIIKETVAATGGRIDYIKAGTNQIHVEVFMPFAKL